MFYPPATAVVSRWYFPETDCQPCQVKLHRAVVSVTDVLPLYSSVYHFETASVHYLPGAAIHSQFCNADTGICFHRFQHIVCLVGRYFPSAALAICALLLPLVNPKIPLRAYWFQCGAPSPQMQAQHKPRYRNRKANVLPLQPDCRRIFSSSQPFTLLHLQW